MRCVLDAWFLLWWLGCDLSRLSECWHGRHSLRSPHKLGLVLPALEVPQARNLLPYLMYWALVQVSLVHQQQFRLDERLA